MPEDEPWSLLIQDVDKKSDSFDLILDKFKQIPTPFFDDVMFDVWKHGKWYGTSLGLVQCFYSSNSWKKDLERRKDKAHLSRA